MSRLQEVFLFQPTSVAGCQLWLDARDVNGTGLQPGNGAAISTWTDKSGSGRNATQATSGLRPTYSNNTMVFAGANYFDMADAFNMLSPVGKFYTMFVVEKRGSFKTTTNFMIGGGGSTGGAVLLLGYNSDTVMRLTTATVADTDYTVPTYQNPDPVRIWGGAYNGAIRDLNLNGTTVTSTNPFTSPVTAWTQPTIGFLGYFSLNTYYVGSIYEILFYNSYLPTGQRQQIEGYLAWKWGLQGSLPSNHPFKTYRPLAQTPFPLTIPPMPILTQGVQAFIPPQISGCQLWLDATDSTTFTLTSGNVSTWGDKSGNGYNFVQTTAGRYPTVNLTGINNLQALSFTGPSTSPNTTSAFLSNGTIPINNSAYSIFTVAQRNVSAPSITGYNYIMKGNLATDFYLFFGSGPNSNFATFTGGAGGWNDINENSPSYLVTSPFIGDIVVNGTALSPYFNGSNQTTKTGTTGAFSGLSIGEPQPNSFSGQNWNGLIGEIIIYTSAVSTTQRQQIEGYLAWKWGLQASLPIGHPYKQAPIVPFPFRTLPLRGSLNVWQPTQISGCSLWLDAADASTLTLSGSTVTQWRDKSGNAANATGSGTPALTQSIQNRLPAIYFNGSSYFTGALTNTTNKHSFFSVFRYDTGAPQYARLASFGVNGQFDYNNNAYYNLSYNTGTLAITRSPTETQVTLASPALDAFHQASILFTGASGLYYTDGGTNINSAAWSANFNYNQYRLGSDQIPFVPQEMIGYIAEVIVYNTIAVTNAERQQIEGYLAWKWGLVASLPSNHPFKRWPPSP